MQFLKDVDDFGVQAATGQRIKTMVRNCPENKALGLVSVLLLRLYILVLEETTQFR